MYHEILTETADLTEEQANSQMEVQVIYFI